jgi:hypothetical protein
VGDLTDLCGQVLGSQRNFPHTAVGALYGLDWPCGLNGPPLALRDVGTKEDPRLLFPDGRSSAGFRLPDNGDPERRVTVFDDLTKISCVGKKLPPS